jgi:hypothetical protein
MPWEINIRRNIENSYHTFMLNILQWWELKNKFEERWKILKLNHL